MIPGPIWTRDGHLLDLALHLHIAGDLDGDTAESVKAHLSACAHCQRRLFQLRAASAPLPPLALPQPTEPAMPPAPEPEPEEGAPPAPIPLRPRARWTRAASVFALAAGLLLAARILFPPPDTYQIRGDGLGLSVYRQGADGVEQLSEGDTILPDDALSFSVITDRPGHLMLIGVDGSAVPYRIYPAAGDPLPLPTSPEGAPVGSGLRIDATPGDERLTAIHCEQPMSWAAGEAMLSGTLREDCTLETVRLEKELP